MFCKYKVKDDQQSEIEYRILQEAMDILIPCLKSDKRMVKVSRETFLELLEVYDHMLNFEKLKDIYKQDAFEKKEMGSIIILCEEFAVTAWVGRNNVNLMISKEEINSIKY